VLIPWRTRWDFSSPTTLVATRVLAVTFFDYDDQAPVPKRNSQQHFGRAAATLCFSCVLEGRWILHRSEHLDVIHEKLSDLLLIKISYDTCISPGISTYVCVNLTSRNSSTSFDVVIPRRR